MRLSNPAHSSNLRESVVGVEWINIIERIGPLAMFYIDDSSESNVHQQTILLLHNMQSQMILLLHNMLSQRASPDTYDSLRSASTFVCVGYAYIVCFENYPVLTVQQAGMGYAVAASVFSGSVITSILQIILRQPIAESGNMILELAMLALAISLMSVLRNVIKFCGLMPNAVALIALATEQELTVAQAQAHNVGWFDEQVLLRSTTSDVVARAQAEEGADRPAIWASVSVLTTSAHAEVFSVSLDPMARYVVHACVCAVI